MIQFQPSSSSGIGIVSLQLALPKARISNCRKCPIDVFVSVSVLQLPLLLTWPQFVTNGFVKSIDPTDDLRRRYVTIDDEETLVEFNDVDIIRSHTAFREPLIRDSDAAIIVYDITSRESFNFVKCIHTEILSTKNSKKELRPKAFTFCVVGNKSDCSVSRQVDTVEGEKLAASLGCHFFETSAATMNGIEECLHDIVRQVRIRQSWDTVSAESGKHRVFNGFGRLFCAKQ